MGCDIHMYTEINTYGSWSYTGGFWEHNYYDPERAPSPYNQPLTDEPFCGRDYSLFAILADVRNGVGFAGCDTGDKIEPLSEPKGIPEDAEEETLVKLNSYGCDGHSHSYFTLAELIEGQKERIKKARGFVTPTEFKVCVKQGKPKEWCGDVGGGQVEKITNEEMQNRINKKLLTGHEYTQVEFDLPINDNYNELVDNLKMLLKFVDNDPTKIRTLFFFDN